MVALPPSITDLLHNQFLAGGLLVGAGGYVLTHLKTIPTKLGGLFRSKIGCTLEIRSTESFAYAFFLQWLSGQSYMKTMRNIKLTSANDVDDNYTDTDVFGDEGGRPRKMNNYMLTFGEGDHLVKYNGNRLWVSISVSEPKGYGAPETIVKIHSFSFRSRKIMDNLLTDIWKPILKLKESKIQLYYDSEGSWSFRGYINKRKRESIILNDGQLTSVLGDIQIFLSNKSWYNEMNIAHQRGYLLYGCPGNGKSSFIRAVASELNLPIYVLNIASTTLTDNGLISLFSKLPENSILVFEDIDVLFEERKNTTNDDEEDEETDGEEDVTPLLRKIGNIEIPAPRQAAIQTYNRKISKKTINLSTLLNMLDGIKKDSTRIIFMTTNRKNMLDAALIRAGRIDMSIEFNNASTKQISELYNRFFPLSTPEQHQKFINSYRNEEHSMAEIQEQLLLLKNKNNEPAKH